MLKLCGTSAKVTARHPIAALPSAKTDGGAYRIGLPFRYRGGDTPLHSQRFDYAMLIKSAPCRTYTVLVTIFPPFLIPLAGHKKWRSILRSKPTYPRIPVFQDFLHTATIFELRIVSHFVPIKASQSIIPHKNQK